MQRFKDLILSYGTGDAEGGNGGELLPTARWH